MILPTYNGLPNEIVRIDDEDYQSLKDYQWGILRQPRDGYVKKYVRAKIGQKDHITPIHMYLHRMIMNCPNDLVVDHINDDGLDNRKANLRNVTRSVNKLNQHRYNHTKNLGEIKERSQFRHNTR